MMTTPSRRNAVFERGERACLRQRQLAEVGLHEAWVRRQRGFEPENLHALRQLVER